MWRIEKAAGIEIQAENIWKWRHSQRTFGEKSIPAFSVWKKLERESKGTSGYTLSRVSRNRESVPAHVPFQTFLSSQNWRFAQGKKEIERMVCGSEQRGNWRNNEFCLYRRWPWKYHPQLLRNRPNQCFCRITQFQNTEVCSKQLRNQWSQFLPLQDERLFLIATSSTSFWEVPLFWCLEFVIMEVEEYLEKIIQTLFGLHTPHGFDSSFDLAVQVLQKTGGSGDFLRFKWEKHHRFRKDIPEPLDDFLVLAGRKNMHRVPAEHIKPFYEGFQRSGMENMLESWVQNLISSSPFSMNR